MFNALAKHVEMVSISDRTIISLFSDDIYALVEDKQKPRTSNDKSQQNLHKV